MREPTNPWTVWTRSASAMPPRQLRIGHGIVVRSPEQHLIQALDLRPELGSGARRQHEQSFLQRVPSPALTAARTGELGLLTPPTALGAVDADRPDAQRHRHDARGQTLPFEDADGRVRGSRQSRDIAVAHPRPPPATSTRPKRSWSSTRHGPFGHQSWAASSHSPGSTGQNPGRPTAASLTVRYGRTGARSDADDHHRRTRTSPPRAAGDVGGLGGRSASVRAGALVEADLPRRGEGGHDRLIYRLPISRPEREAPYRRGVDP